MENLKKPLLVWPSMAHKINPKMNFCLKSLPTLGVSTWFLCATLNVFLQSLCKSSQNCHKNLVKVIHNMAKVGKDFGQIFLFEIV